MNSRKNKGISVACLFVFRIVAVLGVLTAVTVCHRTEVASALVVSTPGVQRALSISPERRLRTDAIVNKVAGLKLAVSGPEFVISLGTGEDISSDDFNALRLVETGTGARAMLQHPTLGLQADIVYSKAENKPWLYKQIKFKNTGDKPLLLRTVELEHLKMQNEKVTYAVDRNFAKLSDWGQPVYTESLWFGVEFPATRSSATADGFIFLRHHPGIELTPGESYETKRAVLGAAESGRVKQAFMDDYVVTLPPRETVPELHLYWCGYLVIIPHEELWIDGIDGVDGGKVDWKTEYNPALFTRALKQIELLKKMKKDYGFNFDSFSYDVPLYTSDDLFVPVEPDLWQKTREALAPIGTKPGFWASFSCIYTVSTHDWGKTQGYELQHDRAYCLAGPKYFAAIKKRLEDIVREHGMASLNLDGMYWDQGLGCNEPGHGHLVGQGSEEGIFSVERVVENELKIMESLRRINPDIVLDLFVCDEWASPWWLMQLDGVHTVAGDTLVAGIPSPWVRDELITARDMQLFEEHRRIGRQFPLWAEDLYGTQVRANHLIDGLNINGEAYEERWEDEFVMSLPVRGQISNNLISGDMPTMAKSRGGLKFLAEVAHWTKANETIYRDFHLIGGEPKELELYGHSHCDGNGRAIVGLRNPYIVGKSFKLTINETLGLKATKEKLYVNIVYPYRKTFEPVDFGGTIEVPVQDYQVLLLEVHAQSRQFQGIGAGRWDVSDSGLLVTYDESPLKTLPQGQVSAETRPDGLHLVGQVTVPDGSKGQIQIMFDPIEGKDVSKPTAFLDGKAVSCEFHERSGVINQDWMLMDVPPGSHKVDVIISEKGPQKVEIGAWLVSTYTLKGKTTGQKVSQASALFPVFAGAENRRMTTLLKPTKL